MVSLLVLSAALNSIAQDYRKPTYGLNLNLTLPTFPGAQDSFSALPGFGFGAYLRLPWYIPNVNLSASLQFNRFGYNSEPLDAKVFSNSVGLYLGGETYFKKLSDVSFFAHLVPSYTINYSHREDLSGPGGRVDIETLNSAKSNFDAGINVGTSLHLSKNLRLDFSYTLNVLSRNNGQYMDARPNGIKLGLSLDLGREFENEPEIELVREKLTELSQDTLYVLNRACSDIMTDSLLSELFAQHYTFSAFKIIQDDEIEVYKNRENVTFFAIVGQFYAGQGEPVTEGIFLLDKDFNLVQYPYPVLTNYPRTLDPCFSDITNTGITINRFDDRLRGRF